MSVLGNKTINGALGYITAIVDGNYTELAEVSKVSAEWNAIQTNRRQLGSLVQYTKNTGWNGTGSLTISYGTTVFLNIIVEYMRTGIMPELYLVIGNEDDSFDGGNRKTRLGGVVLSKLTVAMLDMDSGELSEELSFTFTEWEDL